MDNIRGYAQHFTNADHDVALDLHNHFASYKIIKSSTLPSTSNDNTASNVDANSPLLFPILVSVNLDHRRNAHPTVHTATKTNTNHNTTNKTSNDTKFSFKSDDNDCFEVEMDNTCSFHHSTLTSNTIFICSPSPSSLTKQSTIKFNPPPQPNILLPTGTDIDNESTKYIFQWSVAIRLVGQIKQFLSSTQQQLTSPAKNSTGNLCQNQIRGQIHNVDQDKHEQSNSFLNIHPIYNIHSDSYEHFHINTPSSSPSPSPSVSINNQHSISNNERANTHTRRAIVSPCLFHPSKHKHKHRYDHDYHYFNEFDPVRNSYIFAIKTNRIGIPSSLVLKKIPYDDNPNLNSPTRTNHHQSEPETTLNRALERTNLKRQLVGRYIIFQQQDPKTNVTSLIDFQSLQSLHYADKGTTFQAIVEEVVCQEGSTKGPIFLIAPDTRITFIDADSTCADTNTNTETIDTSSHNNIKVNSDAGADTYTIRTNNNIDCATFPSPSPSSPSLPVLSPETTLLLDTIQNLSTNTFLNIPRTFLFSGPPGVGKTFAVQQVSEMMKHAVNLIVLDGSQMTASHDHPADAAKYLHSTFQRAATTNTTNKRKISLIYLDEFDAIVSLTPVANMLCSILDLISPFTAWNNIVVVAATNSVELIPSSLRRPGRFDEEIEVSPPNADKRLSILQSMLSRTGMLDSPSGSGNPLDLINDLQPLANDTVGYVPADLTSLVQHAQLRCMEQGCDKITLEHLFKAKEMIPASALREALLSKPPNTTWDDIAGDAGGAKKALRQAIEWPQTKRHIYHDMDLSPPRGILLHGPPGCAKTSLARAAAGSAGIAFYSLSPSDVYASSYVGDAEAIVRRAFRLARSASPCILFFDEIDSILGCHGTTADGGHGMDRQNNNNNNSAESRVLSTFLNEMDGVDAVKNDGVIVLGATNRIEVLDTALLRPGRFDKVICVPPPDLEGRRSIFELFLSRLGIGYQNRYRKCCDDDDIDVEKLAAISVNMTGAEIMSGCREAFMQSLRDQRGDDDDNNDCLSLSCCLSQEMLESAIKSMKPLLVDSKSCWAIGS